ncbi:hypothetical protein SPRG_01059 [Saprolegnia parasitica CBS 223.65]|uniref:GOLD domain-containing protein n=1 Tax=Saprolegnia parasitica (strain CBS 223.65) TaxID=695850 RepID=A0A067D8L6_SAPPC|nr:hypothetical protein SPRG_01059 [Saprolegnia parasitica CBS 223.65]KDO34996.1 hypothetical protein SPRG_01059 [Saprolegnia parasitica CBS 223.65]|eukprot:XP_012194649.1 hypothetical protein SPRG_01059 [Saprolegnia parasitica CBS 223.65]
MTTLMSRAVGVLLAVAVAATAMRTSIPSGDPECFLLEAQKFKEGISLNYDVIAGIGEELETTLLSPSGIRLFHEVGPKGRFVTPVPEDGLFQACFGHKSSVPLVVGFSFHADDPAHDVVSNADATKIEQARAVEDMVYELNTHLDTVKDTQSYLKAKNLLHQQVVDSTNNRVLWWSCIEAIILMCMAFWQMSYLRRTFEVRRVL